MAQVLTLALLPPLLLATYQAYDAYRTSRREVTAAAVQTLDVITNYERSFFDRARELLAELAADPVVFGAGAGCAPRLEEAAAEHDAYRHLAVLRGAGEPLCSSADGSRDLMLGRHEILNDVRDSGAFELSGVITYEDGEPAPILAAAVPVPEARGEAASLVLTVDLADLIGAMRSLDLPADSVAVLVESDGALAQAGDRGDAAASPRLPPPDALERLIEAPFRSLEIAGRDGRERRYGAAPLASDRLFIVTGIPTNEPWSWLNRQLLTAILGPLGVAFLAILTIAVATEVLINRHIRALAADMRGYVVDAPLTHHLRRMPDELAALAAGFAALIARVDEREERLKASLREKEGLLREVHHRVKNNLQLVNSLLALRRRRTTSAVAVEAMREAQTRIRALALLHRNLYQQDDVAEVELASFIGDLCRLVEETARDEAEIDLELRVAPMRMNVERAIPLALFLVEALSNAFAHAFDDRARGRITVALQAAADDGAMLEIADDGVGFDPEAAAARNGLGLTLLRMLAREVGGELEVVSGDGTAVRVRLRLEGAAAAGGERDDRDL